MCNVTNEKIINFYTKNPSINFEAVNLIFVDLFEKLFDDMHSTMNSTINSQILSTVGDLKGEVSSLSSSVSKLNIDITNSIIIKFQESKKEYIEDVKNIISNNFSHNNDKIQSLLQNQNSQLIDKTTLLLNDVVPKNNKEYYTQLQNSMNLFHKSISDDTRKILNSTDKDDSLSSFINNFETICYNLFFHLFLLVKRELIKI